MTPTTTAILSAIISSSVLVLAIEFVGDKILARFRYKGWQAVFLANGEVYFGRITALSRNDITLTDIYYLQDSNQNVGYPNASIENSSMSLVKLGEELHGPKDVMTIGRAHILFTETLNDDAEVVAEIEHHKRGKRLENVKLADME